MAQDVPSQLHKRYFGLPKFAEFIRHGCRMNGCMFGHIMQNKEICTELLECLLNIQIDHIEYPELQKSLSAFYETKGVRLDVYVKDSDRVFDIEIQNNPELNLAKRTRYYQSMLDIDNLLKGEDYDTLKESFIIFICTFDPFGKNLSTYTFRNRCIEKPSLELDDKTTKIIFNAEAFEKEKNVAISAFLRYISERIPTDSFTEKLDSLVCRFFWGSLCFPHFLSVWEI